VLQLTLVLPATYVMCYFCDWWLLLLLLQAVGDLPEDLEQLQLTRLAPNSIQQALQCTSVQQSQLQQQNDNTAASADGADVAEALGGLRCADDVAGSSSGQQQMQAQLPCLLVAAVEGDDASGVQLVSDRQTLACADACI
jgi:hypothetical protein